MAVFERPPSSRDVGYVSKERERGGCVRARERQGRPLMRETHKVRRGRCRDFDPFRDFYFADPELTFCESRSFRKVAKHVVLSPTCTLPRDNDQSRRNFVSPPRSTPPMTTPAIPSPMAYVRNCKGAIGRTYRCQPRLPSLRLRVWVVSRMAAMASSEP